MLSGLRELDLVSECGVHIKNLRPWVPLPGSPEDEFCEFLGGGELTRIVSTTSAPRLGGTPCSSLDLAALAVFRPLFRSFATVTLRHTKEYARADLDATKQMDS